jgi:linearmycin/streptolysin S transport system ATP-binding protein
MDPTPTRVNMPGRVTPLIVVDGLVKRYGGHVALAGIGFTVAPSEVVGLLGPNGAGKSSTLGVLATQLDFETGTVLVAGHALPADARAARRALGLVPQQVAVYPTLSARENLCFFARLSGLGHGEATRSVAEVLNVIGLASRADEPAARLSGGMRRRLNLACGILHRPRVVLLDEPVVGVDPQSRERIFEAITTLAHDGAAVLYSTHQMEEAERLCDRVVLLDRGRVLASGTPAHLVANAGMTASLHVRTGSPLPSGWVTEVADVHVAESSGCDVVVAVADPAAVPAVLAAALRAGGDVLDVAFHRPTLADAFFALTGRALRDEDGQDTVSA